VSAAVLTRPVPAAVPGYDPCGGTGRVFRGGRFPEACPNGCPPRNAGGCLSCGCAPSACASGCGCDCGCCPDPYRLPASRP